MWVIIALASLAALIILILCVPLDMALRIDVYGRPRFRMRLIWLFGLVSKGITKGRKRPEEKEKVTEAKPKRRRRKIRAGAIFEVLRTKGLLRQLKGLLKDVVSCIRIRDLAADFKVGLGDPADTGVLFAVIGPASLFLGSSRFHEIRVEPYFGDEVVCKGYLHGAVRLQPIQMVPPFLRFAFSLATIRVVKRLILTKWKRKKS